MSDHYEPLARFLMPFLGIAALIASIVWLHGVCQNYESLSMPYQFIAGFYHYSIFVPIVDITMSIFHLASEWTPYPNLGLIIGVLLAGLYSIVVLFLYGMLFTFFNWMFVLFVLPVLFGLGWFILVDVAIAWLFSA